MRFRLLVVAAMLLTGCASQQPPGLNDTKSQTTTKNRDRDLYECEREAAFAGTGTKPQAFANCMKARGYTQK
jgi:outer membrane biogenesis lipoprotein LolB